MALRLWRGFTNTTSFRYNPVQCTETCRTKMAEGLILALTSDKYVYGISVSDILPMKI